VSAAGLAAVGLIVAGAATVQLTAGFGFALAAVPLLAVVLGPHDAVVVSLVLATVTNGYQAYEGRAACDRGTVVRLLAGAAVGVPIGLALFLVADARWLQVAIGLAVLGAVVLIAGGLDLRHATARLDVGTGVLTGALTTSVGVNGPPMVFVMQARHFTPDRFRATITTVFTVLDVVAVALFLIAGHIDGTVMLAVVAALPGLLVGAAAGASIRHHLDADRFRTLVLVLLAVAGLSALIAAAAG
jgi:uncharacterized membrane protein YfcA